VKKLPNPLLLALVFAAIVGSAAVAAKLVAAML